MLLLQRLVATLGLLTAGTLPVVTADQETTNREDRVLSLPNFEGKICWSQCAGYLNGKDEHKLFYWYHEAVNSPSDKPWVLWLNGGPGCSSLGGMFTELGPFVLDSKLNIELNPYSFNQVANILFMEQPAGVGFSHPNVPADDVSTAVDTDLALRHFLTLHPELQGRDFYVMGESYGGHYVPNTVRQIQVSNAALPADQQINIKGFAVGNGYTDWHLDFNANVENGRFHALTSQSIFEKAQEECQGDYARCFWPRDDIDCPDACFEAVHAATQMAMDNSIDIYDIYNDVCLDPAQERLETQMTTFLGHRHKALHKHNQKQIQSSRSLRATISPVFPTCIDAFSQSYLNLPQVQDAIHVDKDTIPNGQWNDCGNVQYDFNYESELPNYRNWTQEGNLQILIYNGDADYILSHMGNSAWINQGLNLKKTQDWTKWRGSDGQVAGYFERYQQTPSSDIPFTFLTVKGAGHMVPRDRPRHALDMFAKFISGGKYEDVKKAPVVPLCSD